MNTQADMSVKDIRTGDRFSHDGQEYTAEGDAQVASGGWIRIPLARWSLTDPRAMRLRKSTVVLRIY